jgi:glycosyltransferase involved in cell wall biosynthesis
MARSAIPNAWIDRLTYAVFESETDALEQLFACRNQLDPVPGRVVLACGSLRAGGSERQAVITANAIAASLESVTLLCDRLDSEGQEQRNFYRSAVSHPRVSVMQLGPPSMAGLPAGAAAALAKLHPGLARDVTAYYRAFREYRPQVVHAWLDWNNVRAGAAAVLAGVPGVVLSTRNMSPTQFSFHAEYLRSTYRALLQHPSVVLTNNSEAGAKDYATWLGIDVNTVAVVRNGVAIPTPLDAHVVDGLRRSLRIPPDAPVVVGMFRLCDEKQPLLWLEVASIVALAEPRAQFIIFGEGPMREEVEAAASRLGLDGRLHLPGLIGQALCGLSLGDVVLLTSRAEGTPNVVLEAQSLGLPVIATDVGGTGEALRDGVTGVLVRDGGAEAIAAAVLRGVRDTVLRDSARRNGPGFVAKRFGRERMIDQTLRLYTRAGGNSPTTMVPTRIGS